MDSAFNLQEYEITVAAIHRNFSPSQLYEHAIRYEKDASIAENGALVAYSGAKTGRSPKDKRVVKHANSEADVWWGPVNIPLDARSFAINRERARDYLNTRDRLYCFDDTAAKKLARLFIDNFKQYESGASAEVRAASPAL
jgi:phosphoenolpyruvate carboxykinase (ATP)